MPGGRGAAAAQRFISLSPPTPKQKEEASILPVGAGGGGWLPETLCVPPKSTLWWARPGQLRCVGCTSGDPQWPVWDLNLGDCRPNTEPQPRAMAGEM